MPDNVQQIAQSLFEEWRDDQEEENAEALRADPETAKEQARTWIIENSADAVPSMTTVLFGMVVEDNSLAFLDGPIDDSTPFNVLQAAVQQEVERLAIESVDAYIEEAVNA